MAQTKKKTEEKAPLARTDGAPEVVSLAWVLNQLAGMRFPEPGQAYEFILASALAGEGKTLPPPPPSSPVRVWTREPLQFAGRLMDSNYLVGHT